MFTTAVRNPHTNAKPHFCNQYKPNPPRIYSPVINQYAVTGSGCPEVTAPKLTTGITSFRCSSLVTNSPQTSNNAPPDQIFCSQRSLLTGNLTFHIRRAEGTEESEKGSNTAVMGCKLDVWAGKRHRQVKVNLFLHAARAI